MKPGTSICTPTTILSRSPTTIVRHNSDNEEEGQMILRQNAPELCKFLPCGLPDVSSECSFICYTCLEKFKNANVLWKHLREQHKYFMAENQHDWYCKNCKMGEDDASDMGDGNNDYSLEEVVEELVAECDDNYDEHAYCDETVFDQINGNYIHTAGKPNASHLWCNTRDFNNYAGTDPELSVGHYTTANYNDVAVQVDERELGTDPPFIPQQQQQQQQQQYLASMFISGWCVQHEFRLAAYIGEYYCSWLQYQLPQLGYYGYEQLRYVQHWAGYYSSFTGGLSTPINGMGTYYEEASYWQQAPITLLDQTPRYGTVLCWAATKSNLIYQQRF